MEKIRWTAFFCIVFVLLWASGCGEKKSVTFPAELPEELAMESQGKNTAETTLDVFFSNQSDTMGYLTLAFGEREAQGTLVKLMQSLQLVNRQYAARAFLLQEEDGVLAWAESEENLYDLYGKEETYRIADLSFACGNSPLTAAAQMEREETADLSVFITNLSSSAMENYEYAMWLTETYERVQLIAFMLPYEGTAVISDPDRSGKARVSEVSGERPMYLIIGGTEEAMDPYMTELLYDLEDVAGLTEGADFYTDFIDRETIQAMYEEGELTALPTAEDLEQLDDPAYSRQMELQMDAPVDYCPVYTYSHAKGLKKADENWALRFAANLPETGYETVIKADCYTVRDGAYVKMDEGKDTFFQVADTREENGTVTISGHPQDAGELPEAVLVHFGAGLDMSTQREQKKQTILERFDSGQTAEYFQKTAGLRAFLETVEQNVENESVWAVEKTILLVNLP